MRVVRVLLAKFGVETQEALPVALLLLHSFGIGLYAAFFFTLANAEFLSTFDSRLLPVAYIASGLVGYLAVSGFSALQRKFPFRVVLLANLIFVLLLVVGFRLGFALSLGPWLAFAMFLWIGPIRTLVDLGLWGLAGHLFDLQQSKRLFGLIGTGETISSVAGFFLIPIILPRFDDPFQLLWVSSAGLLLSIAAVTLAIRSFGPSLAGRPTPRPAGERPSIAGVLADRYFVYLGLIVILLGFTHYFVDFNFLTITRQQFGTREAIAGFLGIFFGLSRISELVGKVFLTRRLIRDFGLAIALAAVPAAVAACVLPAAVLGTLGGTGLVAFFLFVALAKLLYLVLRKSVFDPSVKVLYQPIPAEERFAFQTGVEGKARQAGIVLAGLTLFGLGALGPLPVAYLLLAVVGAWLLLTRSLFAEYRRRLLDVLARLPKRAIVPSPLEVVRERLMAAPADEAKYSLNVLSRVEPVLYENLVTEVLVAGQPEARGEALWRVADQRLAGCRDEVAALAATTTDPAQRALASSALAALDRFAAESGEAGEVERLARSEEAGDRRLAADLMARMSDNAPERALFDLLWDEDAEVQRAATVAAGKLGHPTFWPRLLDLVPSAEQYKSAASALKAIGPPVVPALRDAFRREQESSATLGRLLQIAESIGGREALELLAEQLEHPVRKIRHQAALSLGRLNFQARFEDAARVARRIEESLDRLTWFTAAMIDLEDDSPVREAIDVSRRAEEGWIFLLLSLLEDPQAVKLMRTHLASDVAEERAFALEIAEQLMPRDLKNLLEPVLDGSPPARLLDRLAQFPQRPLSPEDRLRDVLRRGAERVDGWCRTCAVREIESRASRPAPGELLANLYNSDAMVREAAGLALSSLDRAEFERRLATLPEETAKHLELLTAGNGGEAPLMPIFRRVEALAGTPLFKPISRTDLSALALRATVQELAPDAPLFELGEPGEELFVVVEGGVRVEKNGVTLAEVEAGGLVGEIAVVETGSRTASARARERTRLLRVDQETFLDLVADHVELIPGIVQVIATRRARG